MSKPTRRHVKFFVHEFVTGGGFFQLRAETPSGSLLREGTAMLNALVGDLVQLPHAEVVVLQDTRLEPIQVDGCSVVQVSGYDQEARMIEELAKSADWTVLIAPGVRRSVVATKSTGPANRRATSVSPAGDDSLGHKQAREPVAAGNEPASPVPRWCRWQHHAEIPPDFPFPAVLKPVDGAGSLGVRRVDSPTDIPAPADTPLRLEELCQGVAASVAVIMGPSGYVLLPACRQHLSRDGHFTYLGGETIMESELRGRATRLARKAVGIVSGTTGYLGVDIILGREDDGTQDRAIEINPRLTTSYIGLRRAVRDNLADVMLRLANGATDVLVHETGRCVRFSTEEVAVLSSS